jgi:hypothetical protein
VKRQEEERILQEIDTGLARKRILLEERITRLEKEYEAVEKNVAEAALPTPQGYTSGGHALPTPGSGDGYTYPPPDPESTNGNYSKPSLVNRPISATQRPIVDTAGQRTDDGTSKKDEEDDDDGNPWGVEDDQE